MGGADRRFRAGINRPRVPAGRCVGGPPGVGGPRDDVRACFLLPPDLKLLGHADAVLGGLLDNGGLAGGVHDADTRTRFVGTTIYKHYKFIWNFFDFF